MLDLKRDGRELMGAGLDVSRTVGRCESICHVQFVLDPSNRAADILRSVKEQLRALRNSGFGNGLLRCLGDEEAITSKLSALPAPKLSFSYLGSFDAPAAESHLVLE